MQAARLTLWIALAGLAAACSKSEPPPAPKASPKAAAPSPAPAAPAKSGEIDEGLKERLARQEAASKMFESKVLSPPPPAAPKPPPPETRPAPAPAQPAASAPAKPEPPRAEAAKATPPKVEPPKAEPAKAPPPAAAPAPRTDVAAAKPSTAPEPQSPVTRLVSRVDPEFPREAAGYDSGNVKARMTLDAQGNVTRVEILAANPRRVFDRSVTRALSQWRYTDGAAGRTVDMEIDFRVGSPGTELEFAL